MGAAAGTRLRPRDQPLRAETRPQSTADLAPTLDRTRAHDHAGVASDGPPSTRQPTARPRHVSHIGPRDTTSIAVTRSNTTNALMADGLRAPSVPPKRRATPKNATRRVLYSSSAISKPTWRHPGWAQSDAHLGRTLWITVDNRWMDRSELHLSTDAAICPLPPRPSCPHSGAARYLHKRRPSTQPTGLTTVTAVLFEKKKFRFT